MKNYRKEHHDPIKIDLLVVATRKTKANKLGREFLSEEYNVPLQDITTIEKIKNEPKDEEFATNLADKIVELLK